MTNRYEIEADYEWTVDGEVDGDQLFGVLFHYSEKDDLTEEQIVEAMGKSSFDEKGTIFIRIKKIHNVSVSSGWNEEMK